MPQDDKHKITVKMHPIQKREKAEGESSWIKDVAHMSAGALQAEINEINKHLKNKVSITGLDKNLEQNIRTDLSGGQQYQFHVQFPGKKLVVIDVTQKNIDAFFAVLKSGEDRLNGINEKHVTADSAIDIGYEMLQTTFSAKKAPTVSHSFK